MYEKLEVINDIKKTIFYLDKVIINFPRTEKVLKDKISNTYYEILELIYFSNLLDIQERIISKIKMIDFYFKIALDKKYISYKKYLKIGKFLLNIIKQLYGWIRYEKSR